MLQTDYTLKIDPEFRRLVPQLTLAELNDLEEEIFSSNRERKIRVWYNTILVDYTYYEYCEALQLPFETIGLPYTSREEVIAWICENQLERKHLTLEMWRYLIGKRSIMETTLGAHEYVTMRQRTCRRAHAVNSRSKYDSSQTGNRERIGKQYHIGASTVRKYEYYAIALDQFRETLPDFVDAHLAGKYKISLDRVSSMLVMSPQQLQEECDKIIVETQTQTPTIWKKRSLSETSKAENETKKAVTVKDMPAYDPDAEISSLALTIPSWISTMNRVASTTNIMSTTRDGRERLAHALIHLKETASGMLLSIKEGEQSGL